MSKFTDNVKRFFSRNNMGNMPYGSGVNVWGSVTNFGGVVSGKYSDIYFYAIINKVFNALHNCRFVDNTDTYFVTDIKDFLEKEITHMVWNYWKDGIIVVSKDNFGYSVIDAYKKDNWGKVVVPNNAIWYIVYSDLYKVKRLSTFQIIQNELCFMDRMGSALDFLTSTYGSVCLISGSTMPIGTTEKEELNKQLKTSLGITADKNQFIISQAKDMKMDKIDFDINGLALDQKLKDQYLLLADYFNVPKNILSSDTDSTYENQKAALKRFYSDCISPLCEVVLQIGREIIIDSNELVSSNDLTFVFDNVPELSMETEFVESIQGLLNIVSNDSLSEESKRKITEIINKKVEDYQ